MTKRNDGGYSLPMVLIIISILALIATTLMTVSIDNMTNQQNELGKMQKQYEAQGKLEMVLAELSENQVVEITGLKRTPELVENSLQKDAIQKAIETACGTIATVSSKGDNILSLWENKENIIKPYSKLTVQPYETLFTYDFKITARSGDAAANSNDVSITYSLQLVGRIAYDDLNDSDNTRLYIITSPEIITKSVDIGGVA